ncbi:MAG: dienelactone hydrolase family protein [Thermoproteota archaeon]|nr:dienelactone hydrolase family protein [Thermoproteota archaeon]
MKNLQVIQINASVSLEAILSIPNNSISLVIFVHGSGSNTTSSTNQIVAQILKDHGFSTLLFDLLTKEEQESDFRTQRIIHELPGVTLNKFNIELLTERLDAVTQWVQNNNDTKNLNIGYFGASTGAASALYAASSFRDVKAVVSRGGRTDLVDNKTLAELSCPCLFIVGGNDKKVIEINKKTIDQLSNVRDKKLEVVNGASHLFEEQDKMEEVGNIAAEWLKSVI